MGCEDIKHIMFTCERVKEIWQAIGVWSKLERLLQTDRSGSVILGEIIKLREQSQILDNVGLAELILTGGWYNCWERRQATHGETI